MSFHCGRLRLERGNRVATERCDNAGRNCGQLSECESCVISDSRSSFCSVAALEAKDNYLTVSQIAVSSAETKLRGRQRTYCKIELRRKYLGNQSEFLASFFCNIDLSECTRDFEPD